jgi:hypothetical protein
MLGDYPTDARNSEKALALISDAAVCRRRFLNAASRGCDRRAILDTSRLMIGDERLIPSPLGCIFHPDVGHRVAGQNALARVAQPESHPPTKAIAPDCPFQLDPGRHGLALEVIDLRNDCIDLSTDYASRRRIKFGSRFVHLSLSGLLLGDEIVEDPLGDCLTIFRLETLEPILGWRYLSR